MKMKVLVVGSSRHDDQIICEFATAGEQIGHELATRRHTILVGGDDDLDVDSSIVKGALRASPQAKIEVHRMHGAPPAFSDNPPTNFQTIWHQFPDWDVTVMEVIRQVDGVIVIGGRSGAI